MLNANKLLHVLNNGCQRDDGNLLGCTIPADPKLIAKGWERRFVADARMARDAVDTYVELGYEVRLEPIDTGGLKDECRGCKALFNQFSAVYTRQKRSD
ncbi:MAG: hypothetical protein ACE5NG_00625 [bacterium]